jgi:DNA-binding CsgD family transcriptional regulator
MFDLMTAAGDWGMSAHTNSVGALAYRGPERRGGSSLQWRWLALMLDEIDYGMLLVIDQTRVVHANHVARNELDHEHPLQLVGSEIRVRDARDLAPVREGLSGAALRGLRRMLAIGQAPHRVSVAVVPLSSLGHEGPPATLLMFGKRNVCEELSVQGFARCHGLTVTETQVLTALCAGAPPSEIAVCQGVRLSTVRSQIGSIRGKTGAASIRALVHQVAVLPPLVNALRTVAAPNHGANDAVALRA